MIERVISGGQTGADQAGWRAAKALGVPTGGWMPKGFRTEGKVNHAGFLMADESHPEFAELYGAREHHSREYPPRTRQNVNESCVTIWFGDPKSRGGKLTLDWARTRQPFVYVVDRPDGEWQPEHVARHVANAFEQLRHFPKGPPGRDGAINIAGNRESSAPGIGAWVEAYMRDVIARTNGG
jgi:hypothetical protein